MITLLRHGARHHDHYTTHDVWHTGWARDGAGPTAGAFGILTAIDELRLPPGGVVRTAGQDCAKTVTYVYRGALAQEDAAGYRGTIQAGEFQRVSTGRGIARREYNASRTDWAHLLRISLHSSAAVGVSAYQQLRFAAAERHNTICIFASPDGRNGSLTIHQDALVCSSVLDAGHHLVYELAPGRSAWLQMVSGAATLQGTVLTAGDGAGATDERALSFTAREDTEVLYVDVGHPHEGPRAQVRGALGDAPLTRRSPR